MTKTLLILLGLVYALNSATSYAQEKPAAAPPAQAPAAPAAQTPAATPPAATPPAQTPAAPAAQTPPAATPPAQTPAAPVAQTPPATPPAAAPPAQTPAETPPATAPEAETEKKQQEDAADPAKNLQNLNHPAVAARMGLSDFQRAEVQRLLALRSHELANNPIEKKTEIVRESNKKLFELLTPAQQTLWPEVFSERTIRISFRYQGWADVLQWFAEQAGLQLIMDTPPPGTFNYADQIDYTPSEAIDLLNSVLQTKGYTLVRNGKMLMLFDLKRSSIPVQFLPKLKPENLSERGRFEYTSVIFPLDHRNRADVLQVIEPFKGPYCQIVLMPRNSLMITDTASTLLVLQKVIDSVENPIPGAHAPPPTPSVWKTYKVEKNDPGKIEEIFKEFAPTGKVLRIGNSNEIHYFLPEAEQAKLDEILKMLEQDTGVPKEMVLASYSITPYVEVTPQQFWQLNRMRRGLGGAGMNSLPGQMYNPFNPFDPSQAIGKEIIEILKKTFPAAIVSETPVANNIVVLAPKPDQDKIKEFFDSLKQAPLPEDEPVVKLYRYKDKTKKMDDETLKQLRAVVPTGVFSLDEEQGQVLAVATAKEQEMLTKAVAEMESALLPDEEKVIRTYRMPTSTATRFSSMIRQLAGRAGKKERELEGIFEFRDPKQGLVTIWGTAKQHELLAGLLEEITGRKKSTDPKKGVSNEPVLGVYPMLRGHAYTAHLVLDSMIGGGEFSYDPRSNAVIAVAPAELQEIVKKAVEELDKGVAEDVAFFTLKAELPTELRQQFARVAPRSVVVQNRQSLQVVATGPKLELDRIKAILTASEAAMPAREETVVHTLRTASPSTVVAVLSSVFPGVKATINGANNQLVLQLSGDMKEPVVSLLDQLDGDIEFVPVTKRPSAQLLQSIKSMVPNTTLLVDEENSLVMVRGAKTDVEKVKAILKQTESSSTNTEEIYVHTFRYVYPPYVVAILREVAPEVKVAGYPSHYQLAVRVRPDQKEKIVKLFEQMDGNITFVPLKKELPPEIVASFPRIAPYAVTIFDKKNSQVMIYGATPDVEKITTVIKSSEAAAPIEEDVHVHTFKQAYPYYVIAVINAVYPEVKLASYPTHNQLALRFPPEMKDKVLKILEELDGDIAIMSLKKELTQELLTAFRTIAPHATVIQDKQNLLVMIYGPKPDIEKIQKLITTSESARPAAEEVLVHAMKHVDSGTVVPILKEIYPDLKVRDDAENGRLVIRMRPDQSEAVKTLLEQLDAADPDREKRYFRSYPLDTGLYSFKAGYSRYRPVEFVSDLQKLAPRAKISFDENSQQLIVWGTEEEHRAVESAVTNLSDEKQGKKYGRYPLRRIPSYILIPIIQRMYPTVIPTYDVYGQSVIVEGHPRLLEKIGQLIETLDPAEPSPNDPTVRFYALNAEPTDVLVQGLRRLVPAAMVVPDKDAKQVMVIAKPDEQKIIENNVEAIIATFTAPEEPMLFIYPATSDQRNRLEAFVRTAQRDLKGVAIVPDKSPNQVSVWAKPSEHQLIGTILKQMQENRANEPLRQLKVFHMSIGDLVTAEEILKVSHPDATPFIDKQGNRLLIWATPEELEKITQTLMVQGNLDNRQMLAYPVAGMPPETMMKVIQDVFAGLKITPEKQTRRILVWAAPEEHVKIAEIVEQANKKADPESELAEKFVAYSAANLDIANILPLFKALLPEADVYADPTADKVTVRARVREHAQIKELLEQLREKDERLRPVLAVYPIGEADPVMIEVMLRNQLPNAESMTSDEIIERISFWLSYERSPFYRRYYGGPQGPKKIGYFKVEPKTQSAFVFVNGEDQTEVAKAMEQIIAAGNQEGVKPVLRRYSLEEMSFWDAWRLLQEVAPSAFFESVYTHSPDPVGQGANRYFSYRMSYRDFLAYARESDQEKIEQLVRELNDRTGAGKREMISIVIPEGTRFSREKIIETIQKLYPDITPLPGGTPNQILVWSSKHKLERVQQVVDEACRPIPGDQQTVVKSYPLQFIGIEDAKSWLAAICPNAIFDPENTAAPVRRPATTRRPGTTEPKTLLVLATPLEHLEIEKAITELDRDLPESHKMVPRLYSLSDYPIAVFPSIRLAMIQAFPNAVCTQGAEQQTIMVVATEDEQGRILAFLNAYKEDRESKRPSLEVYGLKRQNYYRIQTLIQRIAPSALIFPGSKPDQISVYGTPKEQADVSTALTRLETASHDTDNQILKLYKVGGKKAYTAYHILYYQFPGSVIFPTSPDEILAWSSPVDHESIAKMLNVVAEAFPEPVLKTYYFKHVPLGEGLGILRQMYAGQATVSIRQSTGDLLVHATQDIQDKIAGNIAEFDVPRPIETESLPIAYDLSDLTPAQFAFAASSIRTALPGMVILPSSVAGQMIVWGKLSDQKKIKSMVDQMITERPETTGRMQVYTINRGSAVNAVPTIRLITPNVRFGYSINPNQLLVWAKDSEHEKVRDVVDQLNKTDPDMKIETYSLRNIIPSSAQSVIRNLITMQGLDARIITYDSYSNQLVIQAKDEDQKTFAGLLEKLRSEERELEVFVLEVVDPLTAYYAIQALFTDEPYATTPGVEVDQNTNTIFVQGTVKQLEKTRKMLVNMGETHLLRRSVGGSATGFEPDQLSSTGNSIGVDRVLGGSSQLRIIRLEGNAEQMIRELEKLWPQYSPNRLLINREEQPLIQKREESSPAGETPPTSNWNSGDREELPLAFFSVEDPEQRGAKTESGRSEPVGEAPAVSGEQAVTPQTVAEKVREIAPNVYVTVNEDGTLTVASFDTGALDRLEQLLQRIQSRVIYEDRDYTIFAVRNVSATLIATRLRFYLRERLAGQRPRTAYSAMYQPTRLEISPEASTNTIYVRGSKSERAEIANLIALFDVSELPGQMAVTKPIKVPIKNTPVARVWQQVMKVYQQKMMSTRLPGDVYPVLMTDNVTNSLEIIAPEPLASEIREYAETLDRMTVEEPARQVHVIPLNVKSTVIRKAIQGIQQSSGVTSLNPAIPRSR